MSQILNSPMEEAMRASTIAPNQTMLLTKSEFKVYVEDVTQELFMVIGINHVREVEEYVNLLIQGAERYKNHPLRIKLLSFMTGLSEEEKNTLLTNFADGVVRYHEISEGPII